MSIQVTICLEAERQAIFDPKKLKPEEASTCQVRKNECAEAHSSSFGVD